MSTTEVEAPVKFRSVSQVLQYTRCPYSFYLARVKRVWQRPAAWLPQGTAVHTAAEAWERSGRTMTLAEAQKVYTDMYDAEVTALCEITPDFDKWFRSGPYGGQADIERRYKIGLDQVAKYLDWYTLVEPDDFPVEMTDGRLGVEWDFETTFGTVPVRGVIDYIDDEFRPRDNKTGNKPGEAFQLGTYAGVIEQVTGVEPSTGDFWMGKTGKVTNPLDLTEFTQDRLADVYGRIDELILAESFDPDPEVGKCMFCSVRADCSFSAV